MGLLLDGRDRRDEIKNFKKFKMLIDLHMHSSASDGTDEPEALINIVLDKNIEIFALTDHDTIDGIRRVEAEIKIKNKYKKIKFIRGVEFSCIAENGKCHILGFNYDYNNKNFIETLKLCESLRREKLERRLKFLDKEFNIKFNNSELENLRKISGTGKPHLANLIVLKGFADNKDEAIKKYIDKCSELNTRIDAKIAINAILSSGGVPVWAHPFGGEGEPEISQNKLILTLNELKNYGLKGLECYYKKYLPDRRKYLVDLALKNNLLISGGSDYHGLNKNIAPGVEIKDINDVTVFEAIS